MTKALLPLLHISAFGAALAFSLVVMCGFFPRGIRRIAALGIFAIGGGAALSLLNGTEVWPQMWIPFALTICGGGLGLIPVLYSVEKASLRSPSLWAGLATLVALGAAFAASYDDANRGIHRGPTFAMSDRSAEPGERMRSELGHVRFVQPPAEELGRPNWASGAGLSDWLYWTWSQEPAETWKSFETVPETWIKAETDIYSYSYYCLHPFTDDATRRHVEDLIGLHWQELTRFSLLPPPMPDLRGKTVFGVYAPCYTVPNPESEDWTPPHETPRIEKEVVSRSMLFAYFPPRSVPPWAETRATKDLATHLFEALKAADECLEKVGVKLRLVRADVVELTNEGEGSTVKMRASGGSGVFLIEPGRAAERISCSTSSAYPVVVPVLASVYFGHPECVPEALRRSGAQEACESQVYPIRPQQAAPAFQANGTSPS